MYEVKTLELDLSQCPSLRYLKYSSNMEESKPINMSHNPLLETVDIPYLPNESLDMSVHPLLESLSIRAAKHLKSLKLSKNPKSRSLDIFVCTSLRHLALSNNSILNEINFADVPLHPKDLEYFHKILERNKPYRIHDGSFGGEENHRRNLK